MKRRSLNIKDKTYNTLNFGQNLVKRSTLSTECSQVVVCLSAPFYNFNVYVF